MKEIKAKFLGNIYQTSKDGYDGTIFSPRYISRTLTAKNSGGVLIYETVQDGQEQPTEITAPRVIEVSGGATKYGTHHPKHGWMNNSADFSGIAPTIDSTIHYWHTLLIEI